MARFDEVRNVARLLAIGLRMHTRGLLTVATIVLGFFTFGFIMSSIWAGNATLGATLRGSGGSDVLLVLSEGAETIAQSRLEPSLRSALADVATLPEIGGVTERTEGTAQFNGGRCKWGDSVSVRGDEQVGVSGALATTPDVVRIGAALAARCGLSVSDTVVLGNQPLLVGAILPPTRSVGDSVLFLSPSTIRRVLVIAKEPNAGVIRLGDADPQRVRALIAQRTAARAKVVSERDYYRRQSGQLFIPTVILTLEVGGLMLVGAVVALLLSMHTVISSRLRALAILMAVGFTRAQLTAALAIEGAVFAAIGSGLGLAAALMAWTRGVPIFDLSTNAQITISLSPTLEVAAAILASAIGLGLAFTGVLATGILTAAANCLPTYLRAAT